MSKKTRKPAIARAYIGVVNRLEDDNQQDMCSAAVAKIELPPLDKFYQPSEFDSLIRDLRSDEVLVVARLVALAESAKVRSTGIGFFVRLLKAREHCLWILEAESGVRSIDGKPWYDLVETTANKIMRGRALSKERAKQLGKLSRKDRAPGLVEEWLSSSRIKDRRTVAQHWRDPLHKNAAQAIATIPEPFEELRTASRKTIERIFGGRTKRAGRTA